MTRLNRLLVAATLFLAGANAMAAEAAYELNIPAEPLTQVLDALTRLTGLQPVYADTTVAGVKSAGVRGRLSIREALARALGDTGLVAEFTGEKSAAIKAGPAKPGETQLPRMVVTDTDSTREYAAQVASSGTKTDTPIMVTPLNVQVVTAQVLEDQKANTLTDALANISGVVSSRRALYAVPGEQITLRGFAPFGSPGNNAAGNLLTDGVRFEGSGGLMQMANVDSIEVLKGPAAILYGRMEPGGVVNVVTKKPLEASYHSIEQQIGSWDTYRTRVDSTGALDESKTLLYRVNLAYDKLGSWRDGGVYDKSTFIAPSLMWKINPQTQLALNLAHNDSRGNADFQVTPFENGHPTVLPWELNLNGPSPTSNKTDSVDLGLSHQFNTDWSIKAKAAYARNRYSGSIMAADFLFPSGTQWMAGQGLTYYDSSNRTKFLSVDLTGHFTTAGVKHTLLVGADATRNTGDNVTAYDDFTMSYVPFDVFGAIPDTLLPPDLANATRASYRLTQSGFYLQDQFELPHGVFVTAGLRQQKYVTHVSTNYSSDTDKTESRLTPRAGILWRARPWASLFGSCTKSFGAGSGEIYPGTPMPATDARQLEAGVKVETADAKARGTVAYFDITKTNIATKDLAHPLPVGRWSVPVGEVRSKGVEVDIQGEILANWNVILTFAHTDARITVSNSNPWQVGDRLANVPTNMGSLWTTYAFRQGGRSGWKVGAGVNWRDAAMAERGGPASPQKSNTPGYSVLNAMASYAFEVAGKEWHAQLNANNLLNRKYWTVYSAGGGIAYLNYGDPRSVLASLRVNF